MRKENIYIDLSKCSEEQQKHIISLLPEPEKPDYYEVYNNYKHLQFIPESKFGNDRWMVDKQAFGKTELTYPEFIKLFEDGEDNNGWIEMKKTQPEIGSLIVHARERDNGDIYYEIEKVTEEFLRWADWNSFKFWKYFTPEPPKF